MTQPRPLLFAPILLLAACGNGESVEGQPIAPAARAAGVPQAVGARSYDLTGFTVIESSGPDRVVVRVGPGFSVRAEGPAATLDALVIGLEDGALTIARRRGDTGRSKPATIFVTLPALTAASLRGSGGVAIDRLAGGDPVLTVAGSGDLSVGQVEAGTLTLNLGGSGRMRVGGTADRLTVASAGSGDVDARGLVAAEGTVTVQGSGDVAATVNGPATVSLVGSGDVTLGEGARCTTSVVGSGQVRCGGR